MSRLARKLIRSLINFMPFLPEYRNPDAQPLSQKAKNAILPNDSLNPVSTLKRQLYVSEIRITMSDKTNGPGNDAGLMTKTKTRTQRPPMYKVMLLNDDYTPMEFVVHVLERFFGLTHAQSFDIMLTVHKKGLAVVGVFSFEVAETKVAQVMDFSRRHQHPLQCTMEKE